MQKTHIDFYAIFAENRRKREEGAAHIREDGAEAVYRLWVDTARRIVSFHPERGAELLEFRDRELFLRCIDGYTAQLYRYQ